MKKTNHPVMQLVGGAPSATVSEAVATDPRVMAAEAEVAKAEADRAKRAGAVRIAEAKLVEAKDSAPAVSVRLARAEAAEREARDAAHQAAAKVAAVLRSLADAEGVLEVAEARQVDVAEGVKPNEPSDVVAARVAVEKAERGVEATRSALIAAQETAAQREAQLTASEQHVAQMRAEPLQPAAAVVAAEVGLSDASAALAAAEAALSTARVNHRRAVQEAEASVSGEPSAAVVVPKFASLDVFVETFVLPNWTHANEGSVSWCKTWWRHTEAVTRLEALWEAFEVARLEPAPAMSKWFIYDFDPHMRVLTDKSGCFHACQATCGSIPKTVHERETIWPASPSPEGQFERNPDSPIQRTPEIEQVTA